ncbi:MAG: Trk family potassium uptake protein [Erysipelotrichaceae bacterium]|nr:Trk family potassium uptake protein [Erysipelotrichaceae bacterium]
MQKIRVWLMDKFSPFRMILMSFMILILAGAFLLSLPAASASRQSVPFLNALFTSASAACVTGLVVYDTAMQWSLFGRAVILVLIQIGGLGVVTAMIGLMIMSGRRISLMHRITLQDAVSAHQIGGILNFTIFFLKGTLLIECLGTILLFPFFAREYGSLKGLGYALFHSLSAFNNAGFDLMGVKAPFSSLTGYAAHTGINLIICSLIILGGAGFMTWRDLIASKFRISNLRLQSKLILFSTVFLVSLPFCFFYFHEFSAYPRNERILLSLFQSVTPRTAGFNTFDYSRMSEAGLLLTILLMLVGGAPGSTAGGMKLTTAAVIVLAAVSSLKGKKDACVFRRRIREEDIVSAFTLCFLYLTLLLAGSAVLSVLEGLPLIRTMFECASALGTVGLTTGITPGLCPLSKIILIFFMYFGRVGGLTMTYAVINSERTQPRRYPAEKLTIG